MKTIRIALIGYGSVGRAFARMLLRREDYIRNTFDAKALITGICTRSRGAIVRPEGIDTEALTDDMFDKGTDAFALIEEGEYDVMVELTPINIMSGQPATDHVRKALELGKHVITANKGPVAWHYRELRDLAREKGVLLLHEATVMDGTPVYNLAKETLMGCEITEVSGIFNATTNFILTEMEKGVSFDDAVAEGRRQGFVEADASMDIDGWDAAAKLTALMNVLMDVQITPLEIDRTGISEITKADIEEAKAQGKRIKLLCRGWVDRRFGQPYYGKACLTASGCRNDSFGPPASPTPRRQEGVLPDTWCRLAGYPALPGRTPGAITGPTPTRPDHWGPPRPARPGDRRGWSCTGRHRSV